MMAFVIRIADCKIVIVICGKIKWKVSEMRMKC